MKRGEMVCGNCIYHAVANGDLTCRRHSPQMASYSSIRAGFWCGEGQWQEVQPATEWDHEKKAWVETGETELVNYIWGEWDMEDNNA